MPPRAGIICVITATNLIECCQADWPRRPHARPRRPTCKLARNKEQRRNWLRKRRELSPVARIFCVKMSRTKLLAGATSSWEGYHMATCRGLLRPGFLFLRRLRLSSWSTSARNLRRRCPSNEFARTRPPAFARLSLGAVRGSLEPVQNDGKATARLLCKRPKRALSLSTAPQLELAGPNDGSTAARPPAGSLSGSSSLGRAHAAGANKVDLMSPGE